MVKIHSLIYFKDMKNFKAAAIHLDRDFHILDHIVPLAYVLKIPLIIAEEQSFELCKTYYPMVESRFIPYGELSNEYVVNNFDFLFACKFWQIGYSEFLRNRFGKNIKLIFCPHGHSEKGRIATAQLLESYIYQDGVLLYGEGLKELLQENEVWDKIRNFAFISNYRASFYLENRTFYDALIDKMTSHLSKKNKTILYAPTWKDAEDSTSFFFFYPKLIEQLGSDFNLIVKLHPLLEERNPSLFYATLKNFERDNVLILHDFPPVYPVLNKVDLLLGDYSSVNYDFLFFKKPLFFLESERNLLIHKAAKILPKSAHKNIFSYISQELPKWPQKITQLQEDLYHHTFGKLMHINEIRERIVNWSVSGSNR